MKQGQESPSKNQNTDPIVEPDYVIVSEKEDPSSERIELPTDTDNTLGLHTLTRAFPNAHGLKFKNPATNAYRALLLDTTGTKFCPPTGGWEDKTFIVIYQQSTSDSTSKPAGDQNAKRRKIMRDSDDDGKDSSDSEKADKRQRQSSGFAKRLKDDDDAPVPAKCSDLIVLGLPFKITEEEVKEYFEQFGAVALVEIKKKSSGASKGFGFIRMETFEGQLKVLNKPIHTIGNRKCNVRVPLAKNGEVRDNPLASAKIFIGRLQEKTTPQQLKEFFLEEAQKIDSDAQILDVYIPKPFRAFAFITFSNPLIVKKMLKTGEFIVDGTSVTVSSAMPKSAQPTNTPGHSSAIGPPQYNRAGVPFPEHGRFNDWHDTNSRLRDIDQYGYSSRSRISPQFVGNYPPMGAGSSGGAGGSMLATGLETLNLNNYKPEVVNAWKAFMSVAHNGGLSPPPSSSPPHHYASSLPPQYQQQMHNRRNGSSSHGPPTWR